MKKQGATLIETMMAMTAIGTLVVVVVVVILTVKGCNYVRAHGVKNIADKVWTGDVPE